MIEMVWIAYSTLTDGTASLGMVVCSCIYSNDRFFNHTVHLTAFPHRNFGAPPECRNAFQESPI